jgi:hypothetical protein
VSYASVLIDGRELTSARVSVPQAIVPEKWKGGAAPDLWSLRTGVHRSQVSLPTLEQRARVFEILATLTGHHTRYCLRKAQKAYRRQVYERYEPLVGYERKKSRRGPLGMIKGMVPKVMRRGFFREAESTEVEKIFSSVDRDGHNTHLRASYEGHKYFFAINLCESSLPRALTPTHPIRRQTTRSTSSPTSSPTCSRSPPSWDTTTFSYPSTRTGHRTRPRRS